MEKVDLTPKYRFKLKSMIYSAGYRTMTSFSNKTGLDTSRLSRIVSGIENPSAKIAADMAEALHITEAEFKELL